MTLHTSVAKKALNEQAAEINKMAERLDEGFDSAVETILGCSGRVVISGMGKSGIIGRKIMATLASTGTPSFFVHPAEAFHGDLGMIQPEDVVILISYSGETQEVLNLIPSLKSFGNKIIAMTKSDHSTLGAAADVFLDISVEKEVCPNNLAPTTSTLVNMALGDVLAVALITARDFQPHDFARFHPGGSLGRMLLTRCKDVMSTKLAKVNRKTSFHDCLFAMTENRGGLAVVIGNSGALKGVVTDGDIRRYLMVHEGEHGILAGDLMSETPVTISEDTKISVAKELMEQNKVKALVVVDGANKPVGIIEYLNVI